MPKGRPFRERLTRWLAPRLLDWSVYRARRSLKNRGPLRILLDNSVRGHAITHETAWISTGRQMWGPHAIDTGYAARIPVHSPDNETAIYSEIRYIPGIAHLARQGLLQLFDSTELRRESFTQPVGRYRGYGYFDLDLLAGVRIANLGGFPFQFIDGTSAQPTSFGGENDKRYLGLVDLLGKDKDWDAQHIWTAEQNHMLCFLTVDFKLCNLVAQLRKREPLASLRTNVWRPSELARYLGIVPFDPHLLSYEGASFPVKPNFSWPAGRRQRPRKQSS